MNSDCLYIKTLHHWLAILVATCLTLLAHAANEPSLSINSLNHLSLSELIARGNHYFLQENKPDSAYIYYHLAANRYDAKTTRRDDARLCAEAINRLIYLHSFFFTDSYKVYNYTMQLQELATKHHFDDYLANTYLDLGNLHVRSQRTINQEAYISPAMSCYIKAFDIAINCEQRDRVIDAIALSLFHTAFYSERTSEVRERMDKYCALPEAKPYLVNYCQAVLASTRGEYGKALPLIKRAIATVQDDNPDKAMRIGLMLSLSKVHMMWFAHDYARLLPALKQMEQTAQQHGADDFLSSAYGCLIDFYDHMGDEAHKQEYRTKYHDLEDSISDRKNKADIQAIMFMHDIDVASAQMQQQQQRHRQLTTYALFVSTALLLTCVLLFVIWRLYRSISAKNKVLYERIRQMLDAEQTISQIPQQQTPPEAAQPVTHDDNEAVELLYGRIVEVMRSPAIFQEGFSLSALCQVLEVNHTYVSNALKAHSVSFNSLLNEYRIKEVCRRFDDPQQWGKFSPEYVASTVGIKSRTQFYAHFKKVTGLTPAAYIKMAGKRISSNEI